jgi:hypothetical protein
MDAMPILSFKDICHCGEWISDFNMKSNLYTAQRGLRGWRDGTSGREKELGGKINSIICRVPHELTDQML